MEIVTFAEIQKVKSSFEFKNLISSIRNCNEFWFFEPRFTSLLIAARCYATCVSAAYLLSGDDIPECGTCQCPLTVKHILMECVDFNDVWNKHFVAYPIKDLWYLKMSNHITSLILLKKLLFISNFDVFILVFVVYFLF